LHHQRRKPELIKFRLPSDRLASSAEVEIKNGKFEIAAEVRKGRGRKICQDTIGVVVGNRFSVLIVADGFGPLGHVYSEAFVDRVIGDIEGQKRRITNRIKREKFRLDHLVERSARKTHIKDNNPTEESGTTATIAIITKDETHGANIADSAMYVQTTKNGHERCFDYGRLNKFTEETRERVRIEDVSLQEILEFGGVLHTYVGKSDLRREDVGYQRFVGRGRGTLLVSDGVTKNLHMMIEQKITPDVFSDEVKLGERMAKTKVRDNSGQDDIDTILQGVEGARNRVRKLVKEVWDRYDNNPVDTATGGGNHYIYFSEDDDTSAVSFDWKEVR
jgi:serine/threonine protein phosphatase PrpC